MAPSEEAGRACGGVFGINDAAFLLRRFHVDFDVVVVGEFIFLSPLLLLLFLSSLFIGLLWDISTSASVLENVLICVVVVVVVEMEEFCRVMKGELI